MAKLKCGEILSHASYDINIFVGKFQDFNAKLLTPPPPPSTGPLWLQFPCVMAKIQLICMNILIES